MMSAESLAPVDAAIRAISPERWLALSRERIFFAHQSVGSNIAVGLREWLSVEPRIGLTVQRTSNPVEVTGGAFMHNNLGENGDPTAKTEAFVALLCGPAGETVTIAMQKYCYADFGRSIDVARVFDAYCDRIESLRAQRKTLRLVHVTTPVLRLENRVWTLLLRQLRGQSTTLERSKQVDRYNDLLVRHYSGRDPIFDLASVESTHANGSLDTIQRQGQRLKVLAAEYTYDGGHLNAIGRRAVAGALLVFLADLVPGPSRQAAVSFASPVDKR